MGIWLLLLTEDLAKLQFFSDISKYFLKKRKNKLYSKKLLHISNYYTTFA